MSASGKLRRFCKVISAAIYTARAEAASRLYLLRR